MHILEQYAVNCGAKIGQPFIIPEFFPLPFQGKYICLHAGSGMDSKNYDYFDEVVDLIYPYLEKNNIKIVQVGGPKERLIKKCYSALNSSKRQMAYIIQNSDLYFGNDTMSLHFASYFQKKIVCASTVLYNSNFYPYWSNEKDYVIVESHRGGNKPTFSAQEYPKTINYINPEDIAKSILDFLKINHSLNKIKTIKLGSLYNKENIFNVIPNHLVQPGNIVKIINSRMDIFHDENILENQLKFIPTVITCNQPISKKILEENKKNIVGISYFLEEENDVEFVKTIKSLNIKYQLFSYLSEESLNKFKIKYMDYGLILKVENNFNKFKEELKTINTPLFYKSTNYFLSKGNVFLSEKAFMDNKPVESINNNTQELYDLNIINENPEKFYIFTIDLTKK